MSALAIILGRAGSKGVPGKNMRPVAGKPCAQWTIEHAQRSSRVGSVLVSSADPALHELAQRKGCEEHERSAEAAPDTAPLAAAARAARSAAPPKPHSHSATAPSAIKTAMAARMSR